MTWRPSGSGARRVWVGAAIVIAYVLVAVFALSWRPTTLAIDPVNACPAQLPTPSAPMSSAATCSRG
jgi:hypothetical protein